MDNLYVRSILAGIFFGMWPLLMSRSGLSGTMSGVWMNTVAVVVLMLIMFTQDNSVDATPTGLMIGALSGISAAVGLYLLNGILAVVPKETAVTYVLITTIIQVVVYALYQAWLLGSLSLAKLLGFLLAGVSMFLLT